MSIVLTVAGAPTKSDMNNKTVNDELDLVVSPQASLQFNEQ